jgi:hypothetical protein
MRENARVNLHYYGSNWHSDVVYVQLLNLL